MWARPREDYPALARGHGPDRADARPVGRRRYPPRPQQNAGSAHPAAGHQLASGNTPWLRSTPMDQSANHLLMRGGQPGPADRMRDLLARTVQDHVTDQRSHASALEEIRKHLEGLEWLVKEVREHELTDLATQLTVQTEGMRRQLDEASETTPAWARALPEQLQSLNAQMKPVAELPALWADLGVVSENVDQ